MRGVLCALVLATGLSAGAAEMQAGSGAESVVVTIAREYATPYVLVPQGMTARLLQLDPIAPHDVVSVDTDEFGVPLFSNSRTLYVGETEAIRGVQTLDEGDYRFVCSIHLWMVGVLKVLPPAPRSSLARATYRVS